VCQRPAGAVNQQSFAAILSLLLPPVFHDQFADPVDLLPTQAAAALQADGVEPEFGLAVVALDLHGVHEASAKFQALATIC
jgi:hypothetical protein